MEETSAISAIPGCRPAVATTLRTKGRGLQPHESAESQFAAAPSAEESDGTPRSWRRKISERYGKVIWLATLAKAGARHGDEERILGEAPR